MQTSAQPQTQRIRLESRAGNPAFRVRRQAVRPLPQHHQRFQLKVKQDRRQFPPVEPLIIHEVSESKFQKLANLANLGLTVPDFVDRPRRTPKNAAPSLVSGRSASRQIENKVPRLTNPRAREGSVLEVQ